MSHRIASSHSRRPSIEQRIFPQRVLGLRQIHTFEEKYLEVLPSRQSASSHSRKPSVEQLIFPQRVLGLRWIYTFEERYLEAVSSRQSASSHSQRPSVEQLIFLQRILGYKTHPLEIYTRPTILTPRFLYLCYSLKPKARDEWLGYISGRWRGFLQSIDQKLEAVWSYTFSGHRSRPLGEPCGRCGKATGSGRA